MGKKAKDYMLEIPDVTVTTQTSLIDVMTIMVENNARTIIVTDTNREIKGIITSSDILRELSKEIQSSILRGGAAEHVMTKRLRVPDVSENTLMLDVAEEMAHNDVFSIVVMKQFQPVGIITSLEVFKWWLEEHSNPSDSGQEK
nr:CBS domain-containing protein [Nitrosomonas nitrosa]